MSVQSMFRNFGGLAAITLIVILGSLSLSAQTPKSESISTLSSQSGGQVGGAGSDAAAIESDAGASLSWQLGADSPFAWQIHVLLVCLTLASVLLGYAVLTTIRIDNGQQWATRQRASVRLPK